MDGRGDEGAGKTEIGRAQQVARAFRAREDRMWVGPFRQAVRQAQALSGVERAQGPEPACGEPVEPVAKKRERGNSQALSQAMERTEDRSKQQRVFTEGNKESEGRIRSARA